MPTFFLPTKRFYRGLYFKIEIEIERHTTQNEAVGDGEYPREVDMEMYGDNIEASDDFNMKNGGAGPSEH